jgi:hypothetical protein
MMSGACGIYGEVMTVYRSSVRKSKSKKHLGRHRNRPEDNTKMDIKEIVCEVVDWTHII